MSWIFNGPGILQGEAKNKDLKSQRIEIKAGDEIPDGFVDEKTMAYLEKQGKISERKFIDKVVGKQKESENSESDSQEKSEEKKKGFLGLG